jgi:hypothetical protein
MGRDADRLDRHGVRMLPNRDSREAGNPVATGVGYDRSITDFATCVIGHQRAEFNAIGGWRRPGSRREGEGAGAWIAIPPATRIQVIT